MYKVYVAPKLSTGTWDSEIDISDYVQDSGIGKIKISIDSEDFDFGLFVFNDLTINVENSNGMFNDQLDIRSVFKCSRNESKVRVVYVDDSGTEHTRFKGIINEDGVKVNAYQDEVKLKVLSYDSILRTTKIESGTLVNGVSSTDAIKTILNRSQITRLLNYDASLINPSISIVIDNASEYDNDSTFDTLAELLKISNSVFVIDSSDRMVVRSREPNHNITNFYGPYDIYGRENIIKILEYNSGRQRLFTSVKVNNTESSNAGYQLQYGFKQKKISISSITDTNVEAQIADALVDEFKSLKVELKVNCPAADFIDTEILDLARVFYPLRTVRNGGFIPIIGITQIDESDYRLPDQFGSLEIRDNIAFKVISIEENPSSQEIDFKLRQIGTSDEDGYFSSLDVAIVGIAIVGVSIVEDGATGPYYAPYISAAVVGSSLIS